MAYAKLVNTALDDLKGVPHLFHPHLFILSRRNQPVDIRTAPDPSSSESLRYSTQAEYDSGSDDGDLEVISSSDVASSPSTSAWAQDHSRLPIHERSQLESGTAPSQASARAVRSSPSQLTLTHHLGETLQNGGDDSQADNPVLGPRNSIPSPVPPKRLSGFLKSRDNHPASAPSAPTHAAASQMSLPLHSLNFPASPSKPHRADGLISRKLLDRNIDPQFERHSKPLETWDMLSDVEREFPTPNSGHRTHSVHSVPDHFPGTPGSSDAAARGCAPETPFDARLPAQSLQALLKPPVATDNPTRGRGLRATSSMIWAPGRRFSPVPSPTRSATTPTSPSMVSLQSGITNIDYGVGTPVTPEDEEEQPYTLRDDGPVRLGSPTLSEAHARIVRTPVITPRPSVGALQAFAPPNSSPLANQSYERLATSNVDPRRRDTVVSIGDTESMIQLYVHSPGPTHTVHAACSFIPGNDESDH
ncbi:hypothetical protein B0F90DRAFT_1820065 [Multifurca ochricompacta]|uniref:Uncharacterized protein n=1 Tax=Multifurca ochricompacta TaxID=376703 RepID=A0AAD4QK40_9AGAM|nr:hypothetical protein B0F90DRAFT_1820065 [Multifurca ochricompacta]